ncbi:MAG TPA: YjbE family putative metal transport protein [Reyranella sp.]|nr:YjbE family putative metal transport protein [Reyranella sp.]
MHFTLPNLASAAFWVALWEIMIANVILSGDNAVVIAMAARNLQDKHRRAAIVFGGAGAIVLLIVFCGILGFVADIPYLKLVGGVLLLWIGIKLVGDEEEGGEVKGHERLWPAIWSIAFANTVMSLDNAIAITLTAKGDFFLICMGLVISVPIIIAGAAVISGLLERFPWLALIGAALIGWIAGDVIAGEGRRETIAADGKITDIVQPGTVAAWLDAHLPHAELVCSIAGAVLVLAVGHLLAKLSERKSHGS